MQYNFGFLELRPHGQYKCESKGLDLTTKTAWAVLGIALMSLQLSFIISFKMLWNGKILMPWKSKKNINQRLGS